MKNIQILLWVFTFCLSATAQQKLISIGPNVKVSSAHSDWAHTEMNIAADPGNPKHLIACSIYKSQKPYKSSTIAYVSFDDGNSWMPTLDTNEFSQSSDPNCTIGPTGAAYFIADVRTGPFTLFARVYRSEDGGKTWQPPVNLPSFFEKPSIIADKFDGKYIYINGWNAIRDVSTGNGMGGFGLSRSRDGGASFENALNRPPFENSRHFLAGMGNCVMLSDGNLACTFMQSDDDSPIEEQAQSLSLKARVKVITVLRKGEAFGNAVTVDSLHILRRPPGTTTFGSLLAVDANEGPFKDRLYVVWADVDAGRTQISFAYSTDKGQTWSRSKHINDDKTFDALDPSRGPDDSMPAVAVNGDGVVGVMWYDRRDSKDNLGWHIRFSASLDGGETFLPSVRVSEMPAIFDQNKAWPIFLWNTVSGGGSQLPGGPLTLDLQIMGQLFNAGDYGGMVADASGVFHPLWADNRTGLHQLWTSAINVSAKGVLHGSPELAQLTEITDKVSLEILSINYDRSTNTLTCETRLTNTSAQKLNGPFKVKFVSLTSDIGGQIKLVNNDDGVAPVFEMTAPNNQLQPNESSQPKKLVFRLDDIQPLSRGRDIKLGVAKADLIVLGGKS
ncbi:MAG TPA: sialidase family protein [Pyrinomonadaceae bacterium]